MTFRNAQASRPARRAAARARSETEAPRRLAWLYSGSAQRTLELSLPGPASGCAGWVILPRAGGAPADPALRRAQQLAGFATLTLDLLAETEARDPAAAFDTPRLAARLAAATRWLAQQPEARGKRLGYLAGGPASGAVLRAAAELGGLVAA